MGSRFHKSVKIAKGVKVNFSKSGASLSLGGHGHSVNFGGRGRGTTVTAGIPGTGLSYRSKVGGNQSRSNAATYHSSSAPRSSVQLPSQVTIRMNDRGQLIIEDPNGVEITDKAVIRKIKALPQFQAQIAQLEEQRKDRIDEMVKDAELENERFINISALTPAVEPLEAFEERFKGLVPAKYEYQKFTVPEPTEEKIRGFLRQEAEENVKGFFLTINKAKRQYVDDRITERYSQAMSAWQEERKNFFARQEENRRVFEADAAEECSKQKVFLRELIDGDDSAVSEVFDSWISSCELPIEIFVDYDWRQDEGSMLLDVDLPEIEDLPSTILVKTESGNLKEKKKTQTELRSEYARLVFGLAVFITANAFNVSPAVQKVLISGYTQRENKEGAVSDDYIYSIKFTRDMFEQVDFSSVSPREFCLAAEHRCNMTSTSLFKVIAPFDNV